MAEQDAYDKLPATQACAEEYAGHARCALCYGCEACEEYLICARGSREEVDHMVAKYRGRSGYGNRIFHWACVLGNLYAAETLAAAFDISGPDVVKYSHSVLRGALAGGHVHIAEWLDRRFAVAAGLSSNAALLREREYYPPQSQEWVRLSVLSPGGVTNDN